MAVRAIKTIADSVLYQKSEPVIRFDQELRNLARDMFDTMHENNGVGLAAVQIGVLQRVLVIDLEQSGFIKGVFVNPVLAEASEQSQYGEEGCLSVPGVVSMLRRPKWVRIKYQDVFGESQEAEGEDLLARAFLHEMDHLDGKVYIDLLEPDMRLQIDSEIEAIKNRQSLTNKKLPAYRK